MNHTNTVTLTSA